MNAFGSMLRYQRLLRGWSQKELADIICTFCQENEGRPGLTQKTISRWENGKCKPSLYYQKRLCQLFNANTQELRLLD